jgi:hypothetical protein
MSRVPLVPFLAFLLLAVRPAPATLVVPWTEAEMTALADDVVTGVVERVDGVVTESGAVETHAVVRIARALKGGRGGPRLVLRQPGGRAGDLLVAVLGTTPLAAGDPVLLFARHVRGGGHRAVGVGLGVYRLASEAALAGVTSRTLGSAPVIATAPFTFLGAPPASRWFEFDRGDDLAVRSANGDDDIGRGRSDTLLRRALGAWTGVSGTTVRLTLGTDAPEGPSVAGGTCDGRTVVQFNDPADEVFDLSGCSGVLAVGGFCARTTAAGPGGEVFGVIDEGDVTVNRRIASCFAESSVAEVLTHEVGHVLGLGHSSENAGEPNAVLRDATMFFRAHLDGRGAAVRADDVAGIRVLYPADDDGDLIPNEFDLCPGTPRGATADATGCACADPGHVPCPGGDTCSLARCDAASAQCVVEAIDCTGGEPCLAGSCTLTTGCATTPVSGFDAVSCALERDFTPAECAGERVPKAVRRSVVKAQRRVARAARVDVASQDHHLERAERHLARALAHIERSADPARSRPLSAGCAERLRLLVGDAQVRVESRGTAVLFDPASP